MKRIFIGVLTVLFFSCHAQEKRKIKGETEYQKELNANFKDASKSPLKKKDFKNFEGLDFFPVDSSYIVSAKLTQTPNSPIFKLPRTGGDSADYRQYGLLKFTLKGESFELALYQNQNEMRNTIYKDYLFLPFTDDTSGDESYGGGRYMDIFKSKISSEDVVILNFNNTYNPYCAYNDEYTCPIVPRKNHLNIEIKAGVKTFKKEH